ncbi:MarR family winged helix-turn-helix transcriptional regulator [Clostridium hydrogenum]|uniref:MarR family winged helix-turn-helix transcriptional regulator n=1 Tax=Clostridium hydrogenum TaxID=2855764 RepID=UPI001F1EA2A3|nr:MarR family transcriptional regulator [Clostridium hydrogenum]
MSQDEEIGMLTNKTNRKMLRFLNSKLQKYDITPEQWNVLLSLSKEEKVNQKQLSQKVDKDQATLVRILDILEKKELVERKSSKEDRRAFFIDVTDKGRELVNRLIPFISGTFEQMLNGISIEEIDTYRKVLMKINENIFNANEGEN